MHNPRPRFRPTHIGAGRDLNSFALSAQHLHHHGCGYRHGCVSCAPPRAEEGRAAAADVWVVDGPQSTGRLRRFFRADAMYAGSNCEAYALVSEPSSPRTPNTSGRDSVTRAPHGSGLFGEEIQDGRCGACR
eukprot:366344-Chlamydomonas_euryale.AAC.7